MQNTENQNIDFNKNVVLFDGVCNLCNGAVNQLIDLDKNKKLYFSSLQSNFGQNVLKHFDLPIDNFDSFIFLKNGKIYTKSDGALEVCRELNGAIKYLYYFKIIPAFIRNGIYSLIAKNRYRWFGEKESCRMPTPDLKARFLD